MTDAIRKMTDKLEEMARQHAREAAAEYDDPARAVVARAEALFAYQAGARMAQAEAAKVAEWTGDGCQGATSYYAGMRHGCRDAAKAIRSMFGEPK